MERFCYSQATHRKDLEMSSNLVEYKYDNFLTLCCHR